MNSESVFFSLAVGGYVAALVFFSFSLAWQRDRFYKFGRWGFLFGALMGTVGLGARWYVAGHPPLSNMYESLVTLATFTAWSTLAFTRGASLPLVEGGSAVLAILMIGIASVFPREARPLIPALQSYWLYLHVSIAFIGEACFALAFAMSYLFCFRRLVAPPAVQTQIGAPISSTRGEKVFCGAIVLGLPIVFLLSMVKVAMSWANKPGSENWQQLVAWVIVPAGGLTMVVVFAVLVLYGAAGRAADRWLPDEKTLDELTYRAIAIGFPLFTVGALIFGMVWAQKAWGRYWGWDPKETWALITFMVYSIYLHLRLTKGWQGLGAAGLSVLGFLLTMFTLFGVNLLLSGLHSYGSL